MTTTTQALTDRLGALDDFGRKSVLAYLAGYAPEAVTVALDAFDVQAIGGGGPGPVVGYLVDGKVWHPSDVTIVRQAGMQAAEADETPGGAR